MKFTTVGINPPSPTITVISICAKSGLPVVSSFAIIKNKMKLENVSLIQDVDVIFFDAFSPDKQPELWTIDVFEKMIQVLKPNGYLVTYCAKGYVRRNMIAAGFNVERLAGPPGKREMLRAMKHEPNI